MTATATDEDASNIRSAKRARTAGQHEEETSSKGPTTAPPPPSFNLLKSPPPEGDASPEEWESWHEENSCGNIHFWKQKNEAVEYRCPAVLPIRFQGILHDITIDVAADKPLRAALAVFAGLAEAAGQDPVQPSELLIRDGGGEILDPQTTTARSLFYGARSTPKTLQVVFRSKKRTNAALRAKHGKCPEGYVEYAGRCFLVEDTEAPWLISKAHGVAMGTKVCEGAMGGYRGPEYRERVDGVPTYDPIAAWWEMCKLLKKDISGMTRKPKGGWSCETAERALDRFTGFLLVTLINEEWCNDYRRSWDPECRKEAISIMKRMDEAAVKLITAAKECQSEEGESLVPHGMLGLTRVLAQTKRLMPKLQDEYHGWSTPGYDGHKGYLSFSKAIPLLS